MEIKKIKKPTFYYSISYYTAPTGAEAKQDIVIEAEDQHQALESFSELYKKLIVKECTTKKK